MTARNPVRQQLVSTIAGRTRHHPDDPELPALRAELAVEGLVERITKTISTSPPLTAGQRHRLVRAVYAGLGDA